MTIRRYGQQPDRRERHRLATQRSVVSADVRAAGRAQLDDPSSSTPDTTLSVN